MVILVEKWNGWEEEMGWAGYIRVGGGIQFGAD